MPNKKKEKVTSLNRPTGLNLKGSPKKPPFPDRPEKLKKTEDSSDRITGERIGISSGVETELSQIEVEGAGALLDLPFRGAHLIWPDVSPLTKDEIEYMSEPLAKVLRASGWQDKLEKAPYVQLAWGFGIALIGRVRLHQKFVAAQKSAEAKEKVKISTPGPVSGPVGAPDRKVELPESDMQREARKRDAAGLEG